MVKRRSTSNAAIATLHEGDALAYIKKLRKEQFDLVVSSPPYNIGKVYERETPLTLEEYTVWQDRIIEALTSRVKPTGSICWQVGSYIKNGELFPLDILFFPLFAKRGWKLRNRIIWKFNFGHNADKRFSGRYETVLWFTKGDEYKFNLDPVRVPQLYPGKRHSRTKGDRAGKPSGNPKGKNPSDFWEFSAAVDFLHNPVWDIPNVKANHPEQTDHPCQFPIELAERCILALTEEGDQILDPFVGTGSSVIAAIKNNRHATGIDKEAHFLKLARERIAALKEGDLPIRPLGKPIRRPVSSEKVATVPEEWLKAS
ncbi:MAG: DNA-methyltransferase [Parcubacteria group bacterium]